MRIIAIALIIFASSALVFSPAVRGGPSDHKRPK